MVRIAGQPLGNRMTNITTKIQCPCLNIETSDQTSSSKSVKDTKN
jgi:hypothetical protein